jgi:hypothetical protein
MKSNFTLKESTTLNDPMINDLCQDNNFTSHPFVKQWVKNLNSPTVLKEYTEPELGKLRGQTVGDASGASANMQVAATLMFNAVIRGFNRYMSDVFCKKYQTETTTFKIPTTEYQELVANISSGEFAHTEKKVDYVVFDLSTPESEKGGKITWTRSLLEDVTFDIQAEMLEGLGQAVAVKILKDILGTALNCSASAQASGAKITISDPITWEEFLSVVGAVDVGSVQTDGTFKTYGPADYCLVSPDVYWQLLNIIQMTNVLYEGSTDPVNKGVIKLALGTTILKQSLLPAGSMIALNSEKAIALVTRRQLKIEPVLFPVWNEYGFIGSVRYTVGMIFTAACQVAMSATT